MKLRAKLLVLILLTNSIRDSTAEFKCLQGYKVMKDNEKLDQEFSEVLCESGDACVSAKGSFLHEGNTYEVSEVRACYYKSSCDATSDISNGNFEKNGLKAILSSSGMEINIMEAGKAGGTTPSELKCCYESQCEISVVEPAEEGNGGNV